MLARRFLYVFALLIVLLLAGGLAWNLFPDALLRATFVPGVSFAAAPAGPPPDYAQPRPWLSRPGTARDPALWLPPGIAPAPPGPAAVFFVPPTGDLDRGRWNARYDDPRADRRARILVASQASAFSGVGRIWAPRYRQATAGALLTTRHDAGRALDLAYGDVARAFAAFLRQAPPGAPILLAAHDQGSAHLLRLIRERIAGTPLARRIVAAYAVGWPISVRADLPALGLPACATADQTGCVLSWQSFGEPADPAPLRRRYEGSTGFTGAPRAGTPILCVNPLTGTAGGVAPAAANRGALLPDARYAAATLVPGLVGARCDAHGLLLIGDPPAGFGAAVLPGNDYDVFDYPLFWAAIRADAARRLAAFVARDRAS